MRHRQIDLDLLLGRADIARDVQVAVVGLNLVYLHASGVPLDALRTLLVGDDDLLDMLVGQVVLPLALLEMLGRVDEQDIIGLLALLQDEDADRDAGRVEQRLLPAGQVTNSMTVSMCAPAPPKPPDARRSSSGELAAPIFASASPTPRNRADRDAGRVEQIRQADDDTVSMCPSS